MYLTYGQYQEYGGTLDETTFNDFEFEAETIIDWYTFNRLEGESTYPEKVLRCMFRLINLAKLKADALALGSQTTKITDESGNVTTIETTGTIASQSNDGVSISYNTISASEAFKALTSKSSSNPVEDTVRTYLSGVTNSLGRRLTYRGFYPNE